MRYTLLLLLAIALFHCGGGEGPRQPAPPPASTPAAEPKPTNAAPPATPFTPPQPWRSRGEPVEVVEPPDLARETWRAFVNQYKPMQKKTPLWRPLPAAETVVLEMPAASAFRCIVTPVQVSTETNDYGTKLKAWLLRRDLLCSADGWRSWTEHPHVARLLPDGTRQTTTMAQVQLRERDRDPEVRETFVLVRDDEEPRAATTGPPKILPNVAVDEE
jgi:hypothetical protein